FAAVDCDGDADAVVSGIDDGFSTCNVAGGHRLRKRKWANTTSCRTRIPSIWMWTGGSLPLYRIASMTMKSRGVLPRNLRGPCQEAVPLTGLNSMRSPSRAPGHQKRPSNGLGAWNIGIPSID